ncbi:DUF4363 family protein [Paenactinomyces guangxiensis]|uniref:DUF4363 family protein n=1 Tax=Paenactinomyces guangxiensis TaxID=1490290 RepID=A0A7W2A8A8_9BACL|nr:DUF4363 family protein [Paenactinomyces guangxiensis]MBA4495421.1 DUF4363 family protein [Paenactinomyces guangxiensis]MBH8592458.1 DUF4363 family protein [Paenactinomyces guangxiensis]
MSKVLKPSKSILYCLLLSIFLLGAWAPQTVQIKEEPLLKKIAQIESFIDQQRWDQAQTEVNRLEHLYKKEKWKLQLFGDQMKYERIRQEMAQLKIALEEKDQTEAKIKLATIRSILTITGQVDKINGKMT